MSIFDQNPPDDAVQTFELCRCRPRQPLNFTIAQREVRGLWTHWFGGKTIGCCNTNACEACGENTKRTWTGHVIGRRHEDDRYIIAIFTKPVWLILRSKACEVDGLLALRVSLQRLTGRGNGPIYTQTAGRDKEITEYAPWKLEKVLMRLYADNANKRDLRLDT